MNLDERLRTHYATRTSSAAHLARDVDGVHRRARQRRRNSRLAGIAASAILIVLFAGAYFVIADSSDNNDVETGPIEDPESPEQGRADDEQLNPTDEAAPEPQPTRDPGQVRPATAPLVVDTGMGTFVWNVFEGNGAGIPSVQLDHEGYVISGLDDDPLFSEDGRTWTTTPLSPELADYRVFRSEGEWAHAGESMWETSGKTRDLLRSDGSQWVVVDLPGADPQWPEIPQQAGGTLLVESGQDDSAFWVSTADGLGERQMAPWAMPANVVDPQDSVAIVVLPEGGYGALVTVHGVHPDEEHLDDDSGDNATLRFVEMWTSPDARNWTNHGLPEFARESMDQEHGIDIRQSDNVIVVEVRAVEGGQEVASHYSTNGIDWERGDPPSVEADAVAARPSDAKWPGLQETAFGFADFNGDMGQPEFWVSADGRSWELVQAPPTAEWEPPSTGGGSMGAARDVLFHSWGGSQGAVIWVGYFE
jgi:hypothetical protein